MASFHTPIEAGDMPKARAGVPAGIVLKRASGIPENDIPIGHVVSQGTEWDQIKSPAAAGDLATDTARGIALLDETRYQDTDGYYESDDGVPVEYIRSGFVWVEVEDAVTAGNALFVRHTAGAGEVLGAIRSDADGTDATECAWLISRTDAGAGELCRVEISLP